MPRAYGKFEKKENGTISVRCTIPKEMADDAIQLQKMGYTPLDWMRIGIRTTKKAELI